MLALGTLAPPFRGVDQAGTAVTLDDLLADGRRLVLYFYPRDFTRVCTAQACLFRDLARELAALSANVAGVSRDSADTHARFAAHYGLDFRLIADPDGSIARAYDAERWLLPFAKRVTYVIDEQRTIQGAFQHELSATRHLDDVLALLRKPR